MIKLVILDVEGVITLPGGSQLAWPLEGMLRLRTLLKELPVNVVLCTGRQEPYGEAVVQALDLFYPFPGDVAERFAEAWTGRLMSWPSIFENGAYFYDPIAKRPIRNPVLTEEQLQGLRRLQSEVILGLPRATGCQVEAGKDFCISINPPLIGSDGQRQSTAEFRPVVDEAIAEFLRWVEVKHSASAVDITPQGISKAAAVQYLLDHTGTAPEEALGVGDTAADQAWLDVVGWAAAPANGRDNLTRLNYVAAVQVVDGLIEILERLRENEYSGLR